MVQKVNGKYYDWASIDLNIDGLLIEAQEITYDDELEKEQVYGLGNKPRGYGTGNYKLNLKISFLREDYEELVNYCKSKGISFYSLVIDKIVVSYADDGEPIIIDTITKVTPTKRSSGGKQGDKSILVDVEFIVFGEIVMNGVKPI
ncbi:hypothetical protein [[Clostridium] colinum]|uniref:hypothetical protein n=1 Tax=[Clostridium] colinum TaxID=36835 RepID=UPI002023DECA|nr:hypothetical protein [[Clostridium] colinum]